MKKLTAGIFATLLAVVSVGAAHAEIASKGYVDQQVGTKADAATVSSLQSTVSGHTSQIGTINDTIGGYGDIVTHNASEFATTGALTSGLAGKLDATGTAARATADASGNVITTTYATKAEIADLATDENLALKQDKTDEGLETTNKTVVGAINEVRGTANTASSTATAAQSAASAAQADATQALEDAATAQSAAEAAQTAADSKLPTATYNSQVGTVSKENMGTTTATTVVAGVKEAIDAAKAADTKAGSAASAASTAQSAVDAVELTIGGYGDIVSHDASEFATAAQGAKADTAVQPGAISDMLTKTEAGTTYYTKTSGDALAGRVTTAEGEIDAIQAEMDNMATSATVSSLTTRVTTAEGDIDDLEAAVNDAESGLAATNTIADSALSTAQSAQTTANAALPKATYNSEVGTVSATNMGTTASTVVTAIKEVAGEASAAASAASEADTKAGQAQTAADAAQEAAEAAQATASAAIPAPTAACADSANKCVLVSSGAGNYSWEVIARGSAE